MSDRWPCPTDPITFESLCADLWGSIWGQSAHKNGRRGQPQAGVDIYGKQGEQWVGIQCKQKDELLRSKLTLRELDEEVGAARTFVPPLSRFIIATTGPSDAAIQQAARELSDQHAQQGLFKVEVWSWTEIWAELNRRPALLQIIGPVYWPRILEVVTERQRREETQEIVQAIQSPLLPCGAFVTLRIEATDEDIERVYGDQAGFRKLPVVPAADVDGRHFLKDRYVDVRNGSVEAAGFFQLHHPGYNTFHRSVKHTVSRFDADKCKKPISENEPLFLPPHVTLGLHHLGRAPGSKAGTAVVLKSDLNSLGGIASCALDNTVLVDYLFGELSVSPPDASGLSVNSLRGALIRLTLDFFFITGIACLPEQSYPHLHNFQLLMGSKRHALTFSLSDLSEQIVRISPNPIARGQAVMPQIIFEYEMNPEKFENHLIGW